MFAKKQIMEFEKHERKRSCLRCGEIMGQIQMTSRTSWGCRAGLRSSKAKFSGEAGLSSRLYFLLMVVGLVTGLERICYLQKFNKDKIIKITNLFQSIKNSWGQNFEKLPKIHEKLTKNHFSNPASNKTWHQDRKTHQRADVKKIWRFLIKKINEK